MFKKNAAITGFNVGSFIQTADGAEKTTGTPTAAMLQDNVAAACPHVPAFDATLGAWKVTLSAATTNCNLLGLKFILSACLPRNFVINFETKKMADLQDPTVAAIQSGLAVDSTVAKAAAVIVLSGAMAKDATVAKEATLGIAGAGLTAIPLLSGNFGASAITKIQLGLAVPGSQMDLVNAPNATALAAVKTALTLPTGIPKNVALPNFTFPMWDASNPEVVKPGLTVTGTIRKDNGAFAAIAGAITEVAATGMYRVDLSQAEMNADLIELLFVAVGGSDQPVLIKTNA